MKLRKLAFKVTRKSEIDRLILGLGELLADYERLATDADGNIGPVCMQHIAKVRALTRDDLSEWNSFKERTGHLQKELSEKRQAFMSNPPTIEDGVDAFCEHITQHKEEIGERLRLNPDDWWNMIVSSFEISSEDREHARIVLFKVKEPIAELLVDYERLAKDPTGNISPERKHRADTIRTLVFKLRERKHYQKRAKSSDTL